jgi:hypothetical protein
MQNIKENGISVNIFYKTIPVVEEIKIEESSNIQPIETFAKCENSNESLAKEAENREDSPVKYQTDHVEVTLANK